MTPDDPASSDPDDLDVEVFSSGSWPRRSPLATLWGSNVSFGDPKPDWAKAAAYLTRAMERHRSAADAYAKALLMDAEIDVLNSTTSALERSIEELGLARAMLSEEKRSDLAGRLGDWYGDDDEEPDWVAADDEPSTETAPPDSEIPVTVPLGIDLGDDRTAVRLRDARVFSRGVVVTADLLLRRPAGMTDGERRALEERFSEAVHDSDASWSPSSVDTEADTEADSEAGTDAQFLSGNVIAYRHAAIAWCEYWVETRESTGTIDFTILDPLSPGVDRRNVSLDAAVIADARSRVISATTGA